MVDLTNIAPNLHNSVNEDKYIQACLNGVLDDIENAPSKLGNKTLNKKAFRLYQAVGAGQLTEQEVTQLLEQSAKKRKIPQAEINDTLKSARKGMSQPDPFGNLEGICTPTHSPSVADHFDDLDALAKQDKSLKWYERIKDNRPEEKQPYLVKKNLTQYRDLFFTGEDKNGSFLASPLHNEKGDVCGFVRIYDNGEKRNTRGCGATGTYYSPFNGDIDSDVCYITEGAADACSITAVTGCDAHAATSSGTMLRVAELMKKEYKTVICCLDNDKAGHEVGAKLLKAGFKCVIPKDEGSDFSDVFISGGEDAVNEQLKNEFKPTQPEKETDPIITLDSFVMSIDDIDERLQQMAEDVFILGGMAALQQITTFFAKPNTGKTLLTLKLIIDDVKNGIIDGEKVFYINADDGGSGAMRKARLIGQHGIKAVTIGENGFKTGMLLDALDGMIKTKTASGRVVIIDTYKKFANQMDKNQLAPFNSALREFTVAGGAVILLAHVNKNRDNEGKLVAGGVSDAVDDTDAAYMIDLAGEIVDNSNPLIPAYKRTVLFENQKKRGDNIKNASYSYTDKQGQSYADLINSVMPVDTHKAELDQRESIRTEQINKRKESLRDKALELYEFVADHGGEMLKTEIYTNHKKIGLTQRDPAKILDLFEGEYWTVKKSDEGNARTVTLIRP